MIQPSASPGNTPITKSNFNLSVAIECAAKKYSDAGWTVMMTPKGGINDFVAGKTDRFHFVQVVIDPDDMKYHGLSKNSFIQNAFSNNAAPVYAYVRLVTGSNSRAEVRLEDVNSQSRLIVGGGGKPQSSSVVVTQKPAVTQKPVVKTAKKDKSNAKKTQKSSTPKQSSAKKEKSL